MCNQIGCASQLKLYKKVNRVESHKTQTHKKNNYFCVIVFDE